MIHKRNWKSRLLYLFFVKDTEHIRFFLSVSSLVWASQLFFAQDTFNHPTYQYMHLVGGELMWCLVHLFLFLLSAYSMLEGINNQWLRKIEPSLSFLVWTTSAVCMTLADFPFSAALSTHIVSALMSWWLLVRIEVE
jgi:hypothetical protein